MLCSDSVRSNIPFVPKKNSAGTNGKFENVPVLS